MDREFSAGRTAQNMKVSGKTIKRTVGEFFTTWMVMSLTASGNMIKLMALELT